MGKCDAELSCEYEVVRNNFAVAPDCFYCGGPCHVGFGCKQATILRTAELREARKRIADLEREVAEWKDKSIPVTVRYAV